MRPASIGTFLLAVFAGTSATFAHNGLRFFLTLENGKLLTNLDNFQNAHNITPNVRVFQGSFGKDPENPLPNFTQFPGLSGSVTAPTALAPGSSVSFNILDTVKYWDGSGAVNFVTSPETISISSGANLVTSSGGFVPGYTLVASVPSADGWHTHPGYTLNPDDGGQYHDGVYLMELSMTNNNVTTLPFWVVFGQNADTAVLSRAVDAVNTSAVPEPASLAILSIGAIVMLRRPARA